MTAMLLYDAAVAAALDAEDPEERFVTSGVSWSQYERLLSGLGENAPYRITYVEGMLEIMSPSRRHEVWKKNLSRLLEAYFEETRTRFWGMGSTTWRRQERRGGTEADECYCLGEEKDWPDLAIDIVLTSGGIEKLQVSKRLDIQEVWLWYPPARLEMYTLHNNQYILTPTSLLLPQLDSTTLILYAARTDPLEALMEYRQRLRLASP